MPKLTIDGRTVEVAAGTNLIEAARTAGIEIPYFCYHPYLTVVGQCRICMVEIEGQPRLAIACATQVADGMVVKSETSERAKEAREAVMEFLLANHPLDCPVCDQAGECLLQDHSMNEQNAGFTSHMAETRRTFPGYERRLIGPQVIQNQNRCIHCSRCIRFTQEISETSQLTYKSRGNSAFIDTFDGKPFDDPMSACAADVCPVGALTVREFRFRKRAWKLRSTPSICPGCSIGCNIFIEHYERVVYRFSPRENPAINATWLCDYGRFLAETLNGQAYLYPQRREGGHPVRVAWGEAIAALAAELKAVRSVRVVASANLSNEELYLARELFGRHLGGELVVPVFTGEQRRMKNGKRDVLLSTDAHPNSLGARRLGLATADGEGLVRFLGATGGLTVVLDVAAHPALASEAALQALGRGPLVVFARDRHPAAELAGWVLPTPSVASNEGTFVSSTGATQRFEPAFAPPGTVHRTATGGMSPTCPTIASPWGPPGEARPLWIVLGALAREIGAATLDFASPSDIFAALTKTEREFAGLEWETLGRRRERDEPRERLHVG
ncbi:MAG TPA: 2Fe-2S iron-sulfur cluster-binding protein [Thermoanaerobaculaceae bacterium]|nr:2Fe-2S iron-sulfur cluster-binding protein [Thermoanaerobaculaceae bacterium]